jgi:hypothetical protein
VLSPAVLGALVLPAAVFFFVFVGLVLLTAFCLTAFFFAGFLREGTARLVNFFAGFVLLGEDFFARVFFFGVFFFAAIGEVYHRR